MRVVILGSGRGSNAEALLRAEREGRLGRAHVVAVFSDRPEARILELARSFGKRAEFLDPGPFKSKFSPEREAAWVEAIRAEQPDLVVLAGFMRVIKETMLNAFAGRIINLHPSLLPSFPGLDGIGQAWRRGVKITGCTVHVVTAEVDGGPILDQAAVRIETSDTLDALAQKIHAAEHALLPAVVARLSIEGLNSETGHAR
ncbi:MAG: phosphoribosylglycinamide formyltransferase [Opitutaceae bacterium]|nr:phosphoribosylglycinamide formyltransferase [Opitutaceae bacterium]